MSSLPETLSGSDAYAQIPQHNHLAARTILDHSNGELPMVMPMWGTLGTSMWQASYLVVDVPGQAHCHLWNMFGPTNNG